MRGIFGSVIWLGLVAGFAFLWLVLFRHGVHPVRFVKGMEVEWQAFLGESDEERD